MPNDVFQALSRQKIDVFRSTYSALSRELFYDDVTHRLRHSAEFGAYRERLCADFLKLYIPTNLNVGSGFLINKDNAVSTQCDLAIFDPRYTPLVEDAERRRFFPVETVVGVGEVKSALSKADLFAALTKLAEVKRLRNVDGSPIRRDESLLLENLGHHFDYMVSFLICEKLSFQLDDLTAHISRHYDEEQIPVEYRHNLVLSIEDGILCYKNHLLSRENVAWMYPQTRNERMKNKLVFPGSNNLSHFGFFTAYMFMMCTNATVYLPELRNYDIPPIMGYYQDQV